MGHFYILCKNIFYVSNLISVFFFSKNKYTPFPFIFVLISQSRGVLEKTISFMLVSQLRMEGLVMVSPQCSQLNCVFSKDKR